MVKKKEIQMDSLEDLAAYRIRRLGRQTEMMQKMTTKPIDLPIDALFTNYAAVLTVSALVGYTAGHFVEDFGKNKKESMGEPVQRQFFQPDQLRLIDLLAYAHTREPTIIRRTEKFEIFSAYAAAGFDLLCEKLDARRRDWTSAQEVIECGKILATLYLKGAKSLSVLDDLTKLSV